MTNYQYPRQAIPPRETDRIDSSWTVVFLSRSRRPNRISHETKDLLTMKFSQVGERDRAAGRGHGRRVKKENREDGRERKHENERERGREEKRGERGQCKQQEDGRRQETRAEKLRESPGLLDSEVSGGRSLACCQLVSLSAHARWHRGDRRPRMDSHTNASRRGRTHNATVPDAYCYSARTLFRMHVKSETSLRPALRTSPLRGLHAAGCH